MPGLLDRLRPCLPAMTEQLAQLVECESPSEDPSLLAACADVVDGLGSAVLGRHAERLSSGGLTHLRWSSGRPRVMLVGHYDTVWPAGTVRRWPFSIGDGGRATGPGAFDMKAGIVQLFHALAALGDPEGTAVLLTADEETGSATSRALIEGMAREVEAALVLEPSVDGALKIARKGTSMYELSLVGRAAHAGVEPEKGVNATVELAHQVLAITGIGRPEEGTTVTPTVTRSGTTTNTVPALASLSVDARASTVAEQERVDREIRLLRPVLDGARIEVAGGINRPPLDPSASAALMDRARLVATRMGLPCPTGVGVGGGSDGNFTAAVGTPTLDGLGADGAGAHAEGEHVVLSAMPERAALLAGLVADLLDLPLP